MRYVIFSLLFLLTSAFRCVNFYGFETTQKIPVCSWTHPPEWYLDKLKESIGINSVRVPFSYEYAAYDEKMEGLHNLISRCEERNLSVILDYHRGYADHQGPSPIENGITFEMYSNLWLALLNKLSSYKNIRALSLFNEYQGTNATEAEMQQLQMARNIESVFPGRYMYMLGCVNWGADCRGMYSSLYKETFGSRAMIEIHIYDFQGSFDSSKFPPYPFKVFVGEIGWTDSTWARSAISYLKEKRIRNICIWTIAHSGDTSNLFENDCETLKSETVDLFNSLYQRRTTTYEYPVCLRGSHF